MRCSGDDKQLFVAFFDTFSNYMLPGHALKGIFAEVAAVGLLAVDKKHRSLNLTCPGQKGLVQEALAADDVPAVIGVAAALVIAGTEVPHPAVRIKEIRGGKNLYMG